MTLPSLIYIATTSKPDLKPVEQPVDKELKKLVPYQPVDLYRFSSRGLSFSDVLTREEEIEMYEVRTSKLYPKKGPVDISSINDAIERKVQKLLRK